MRSSMALKKQSCTTTVISNDRFLNETYKKNSLLEEIVSAMLHGRTITKYSKLTKWQRFKKEFEFR